MNYAFVDFQPSKNLSEELDMFVKQKEFQILKSEIIKKKLVDELNEANKLKKKLSNSKSNLIKFIFKSFIWFYILYTIIYFLYVIKIKLF